jgi:hypothetical protein
MLWGDLDHVPKRFQNKDLQMATDVSLSRIFTDQNHSISVLEQLNEHRMSYRFCDVILRVGKDEVYAHSNVLAAASPYYPTLSPLPSIWISIICGVFCENALG